MGRVVEVDYVLDYGAGFPEGERVVGVGGVGGVGVLDCCFIVFSVVSWRSIMVLLVVVTEGKV